MNQNNSKKVVVLTTGGTIAGVSHDAANPHNYQAAELSGEALMAQFGLSGESYGLEEVARIDSAEMDEATLKQLLACVHHYLQDNSVGALVITHGSDTIEETAFLLQATLNPVKPVVLTCAMRSANHPQTDGPGNLRDALTLARAGSAWQGVWVVCASEVHAPMEIYKAHSRRVNAFDSEGGCVAKIAHQQINLCKPRPTPVVSCDWPIQDLLRTPWPHVAVVMHHTMGDGALLELILQHQSPKAVLVVGTGNGTVSQSLQAAIDQALAQGVEVAFASRCSQGGVQREDAMQKANRLSWPQARLALMLRVLTRN
jgi:L-asparaginase